jgi:hypothetical protein
VLPGELSWDYRFFFLCGFAWGLKTTEIVSRGTKSIRAGPPVKSTSTVRLLLGALFRGAHLSWNAQEKSWSVSARGANAVLLKIDECQARISTPSALMRKGSRPAVAVLPPLPALEVTAGQVVSDKVDGQLTSEKQRAALLAELREHSEQWDGRPTRNGIDVPKWKYRATT